MKLSISEMSYYYVTLHHHHYYVLPQHTWHKIGNKKLHGDHRRILGFPDWSHYYFFQVAPQLYSRGWVDPVPDPLLLRKSGSARNRTGGLIICSQELWPLDHRATLYVFGQTAQNLPTHIAEYCTHIYHMERGVTKSVSIFELQLRVG
jgi:hypothetical protein